MINKVILTGRLTSDIKVAETKNGKQYTKYEKTMPLRH